MTWITPNRVHKNIELKLLKKLPVGRKGKIIITQGPNKYLFFDLTTLIKV